MQKNIIISTFLLLAFSCSTNNSERFSKAFPETIKLTAEKVKINEVINPVLILLLDDYLVVQNEYHFNMDCFFVYSLDTFDFLFSFGRLGQGPGEYIAPRLVQNSQGNILSVFDQASRRIDNFQITDTKPILLNEMRIKDARREPFQELSWLNDSIIILLSHDYALLSYNINKNQFIDTLRFNTDIRSKLGAGHTSFLESFHFGNYNNQIVVGHNFIDKLSIGSIYNGKFTFNNKNLTSVNVSSTVLNNRVHYLFVAGTSNYIFAQYYGLPFRQMQPFPVNIGRRNLNFYIEVYDWNLSPVALLKFDNAMLRFAVDEKRKKILTWNPLEDFDYLLVYRYNFQALYADIERNNIFELNAKYSKQ